jgi:cytosine/adenosine deaminase-related metal-dependent hydrolase
VTARLIRGRVLSFGGPAAEDGHTVIEDGAVRVRDGLIEAVGAWAVSYTHLTLPTKA